MRAVLLSACLFTASCATARPGPGPVATAPDAKSEQDGLLARALAPISEAVLAEGYRAIGAPEHGFLAPSARLVQRFVLAPRTCVAIAAIASPTVGDLDAAIYAADGSTLAEDDTTGARPIVRLCAGERGIDAYLAYYAFQGMGSFAAQRMERPLEPADAFALAEREREGLASEQAPGFTELLRGLHGRGYEDDGPITEVPLVSGSALRLATRVQGGRCYGAVADGSKLRMRLLDAAGRELALGVGAGGPAALQYCAREDAELVLELSSEGQERSARLARLHAPQAAVGSARAVWLGEPSDAFALAALSAKQVSRELRCDGKPGVFMPAARLHQGGVLERELKAERCLRVEATLHEGLSVVTLRVEDSGGTSLAERDLLAPNDGVSFCPARPGPVRVTMIGRAGFGALSLDQRACTE
jgi:hypothetical protein